MIGHNFSRKIVGFMYCAKCGLIRLGNQATRQAERQACQAKGGAA
jgi:hypothetical protein